MKCINCEETIDEEDDAASCQACGFGPYCPDCMDEGVTCSECFMSIDEDDEEEWY